MVRLTRIADIKRIDALDELARRGADLCVDFYYREGNGATWGQVAVPAESGTEGYGILMTRIADIKRVDALDALARIGADLGRGFYYRAGGGR